MVQGKTLQLEATTSGDATITILKALGSTPRWRILEYLAAGSRSINEIAEALDFPASTVAAHIKILEDAELVHSELRAATHGLQKVCTRLYDNVLVQLPFLSATPSNIVEVSMPIGAYTSFEVQPTCGLATSASLIGYLDDPLCFYEPERVKAGLLWFRSGYVEYTFPNRLPKSATPLSIQMSMEICSEAPFHNLDWPSDISLWINGCEVGTWTSPSDFGGQRGALTPLWWDTKETQYGLLKRWLVNHDGTQVDGVVVSSVSIQDLAIEQQPVVTVRIGVKPDAIHPGGMNLLGYSFGNYPQDLLLRLEYLPGRRNGQDG